jgi:hypothetical protein
MGRGTDLDAAELREAGCRVHLNANDEEKWEYLRHLDVFVSCSLWEGFNLPLVEAQAVGTLAVAFDCGAHPETCPLTFPNLAEMVGFIGRIANDPELLSGHARAGYRHARGSFRWSEASSRFETLVLSAATSGGRAERRRRPRQSRAVPMGLFLRLVQWRQNLAATIRSLRLYGVRITLKKARRRLREAFQARGG